MTLDDRYQKFLENSGKMNSYNLAYAWIKRQDESRMMTEGNRRSTAETLSKFKS